MSDGHDTSPARPNDDLMPASAGRGDVRLGARRALGAQVPVDELARALAEPCAVAAWETGPRSATAEEALARVEPVLARIGVTRVAEISGLSEHAVPVFQTARPALFGHPAHGQNSGAQGKALTPAGAAVAAAMESVEAYSAEPRNIVLCRATRAYLAEHRAVLDPAGLATLLHAAPPEPDEALMWAEAYAVEEGSSVLVPAEAVYYPFFAEDYATRRVFPCTSDGLGAGLTYHEAALQALCEVVERHYWASWERGLAQARQTTVPTRLQALVAGELRLYSLHLVDTHSADALAVMCALLEGDESSFFGGFAAARTAQLAAERAVLEAAQSAATISSGAREDIDDTGLDHAPGQYRQAPVVAGPAIPLDGPDRVPPEGEAHDLRAEFRAVLAAVHSLGLPLVLLANLTRAGIDVPVVRAIVPGVRPVYRALVGRRRSSADVVRASFRIVEEAR